MNNFDKSETLLDKAKSNYKAVMLLYNSISEDDSFLNIVGYHLQQTVELYLKHHLEINAIKYPLTHDIGALLSLIFDNKIECETQEVLELLYDLSGTITMWEAKTRYIKNYRAELRQIDRVLSVVKKILEV